MNKTETINRFVLLHKLAKEAEESEKSLLTYLAYAEPFDRLYAVGLLRGLAFRLLEVEKFAELFVIMYKNQE